MVLRTFNILYALYVGGITMKEKNKRAPIAMFYKQARNEIIAKFKSVTWQV